MRHSETPSGSGSTTPSKSKHNLQGWHAPTPSQSHMGTHIPLLLRETYGFKVNLVFLKFPPTVFSKRDCLYFSWQNLYGHSSYTVRKQFCRSRPFCKAIKREGKDFRVQAGKAWTFPAIKLSGKAFCIVKVRNTDRLTII